MTAQLWLQADGWNRFSGLVHGFSGRLQDRTATLSGPGMAGLPLSTLKQVHGDDIVVISRYDRDDKKPEADGMITTETGILLGIATADCVPVLIIAPEKKLVAALHAGWRGTLKGISVRAVETLATHWEVKPKHLWVALGPAIGGCCYEVGREVGEVLYQRWGTSSPSAWKPAGAK
ncbi:MAG: polyphenol oxidase family protein, partial [Candidatus Binatia bacterium]